MNIGNRIRELRRQRGITQEQLADSIGVSFQAVSKWETGIALPAITLTPLLASYFGVSMDELFDFSLQKIEAEVMKIVDKAYEFRFSDSAKSREILEAGLKDYPENEILLNNLLYVVEEPDETIDIASALIAKTRENDIKYDALRFLAYAYKEKGDIKSAEAAIGQIPELYFSKLGEDARILEGTRQYEAADKQKWICFEEMLNMMGIISQYYKNEGKKKEAACEAEKALKLIGIIGNSCFEPYAEKIQTFFEEMSSNQD